MPGSVHAARWTSHLADRGWDLHLFGATPTVPHEGFRDIAVYGFSGYRAKRGTGARVYGVWPFRKGAWHVGRAFTAALPAALALLIRRIRPDVVHSLEMQHAGYLTLAARRLVDRFPPWIVTNWGSDIYYFQRFADHRAKIRAVLEACDYYTSECERDVALARRFGFNGDVLAVLPNAGGLDLDRIRALRDGTRPSQRRGVVLKAYGRPFGRSLVALRAIAEASDMLREYVISVHLADRAVAEACAEVARSTGVRFDLKPRLPHDEMLRTFGRARFSIALSVSDGISTSSLEALALGALPVQSNTSCLDEWTRNGETALLVDPEDVGDVARAIRRAATDDALVDRAAEQNAVVVATRLDRRLIEPAVVSIYERAAAGAVQCDPTAT